MKRTLIEMYALSVCFFTVACLVIVTGIAMWDVVQVIYPEFTISSNDYENHLDNETYKIELATAVRNPWRLKGD